MATITSKMVVDELLENESYYLVDSPIYAVTEYKNELNKTVWGITWIHDPKPHRYMVHNPPHVNHPKILWCKDKNLVSM